MTFESLSEIIKRVDVDDFDVPEPTDTDDTSSSSEGTLAEEELPKNKVRKVSRPWVSYEAFMWVASWTLIIIAIADRFHWQVWPRNWFTLAGLSWGSDRTSLKPGPWSVKLYDIIARVSGRHAILCYNLMLITRLESWEWIFTNSKFINRFIDTSNIVNANIRLHAWNGIGLCVLTLLHVWSILLPVLTNGWSAKMIPGYFAYPISERTPPKCGDEPFEGCWPGDANVELQQMGLQADDVFRLCEMTLFLLILMPLSVRWLASRWHAGMFLHRIINIVYFVDIVRRHSHPHSWILNTPIFVLYCFDKIIWANCWRRNANPKVKQVKLGNDFMVLYWKSPFGTTDTIGPDYALRLNDSSFLEGKHVFTCFENRCSNNGVAWNDGSEDFDWNVGAVIRIFRNVRKPALGAKDTISHTWRMYDTPNPSDMLVTGPRQGEMSEVLKKALLQQEGRRRIVAIGAGSAVNYLIDCLQWNLEHTTKGDDARKKTEVTLVYTTRDFCLFRWSCKVIRSLLEECEACKVPIVFKVTLAFTGKVDIAQQQWFTNAKQQENSLLEIIDHRADLQSIIGSDCIVFCQGSASVKNVVYKACKSSRAVYYGGRGGANVTAASKKKDGSTSQTTPDVVPPIAVFAGDMLPPDVSDDISV